MGRCVNKRRAKSDAACDSVTLHRALRSPPVPRVTQERAPELHDDSKGVIARRAQCTRDTHRVGSRDSSLRWRPPVPVAVATTTVERLQLQLQSPESRVQSRAYSVGTRAPSRSRKLTWSVRSAYGKQRAEGEGVEHWRDWRRRLRDADADDDDRG